MATTDADEDRGRDSRQNQQMFDSEKDRNGRAGWHEIVSKRYPLKLRSAPRKEGDGSGKPNFLSS